MNTHWVLVVMGQVTRRIVGFGVHAGDVDGVALCRMFNKVIVGMSVSKYLSTDNDPLFTYHQWLANLRILEIDELKTVPYTPVAMSGVGATHPATLHNDAREKLCGRLFQLPIAA